MSYQREKLVNAKRAHSERQKTNNDSEGQVRGAIDEQKLTIMIHDCGGRVAIEWQNIIVDVMIVSEGQATRGKKEA